MSALDQTGPEGQDARITFRDGVPVSERFGDPYYSLQNGAAESAHVFLGGNGLPGRYHDGFTIAELGFGTGLNLLVALAAWEATGQKGRFSFTSFEAFPLDAAAISASLSALPEPPARAEDLTAAISKEQEVFSLGAADVTLIPGDARATLPRWTDQADAWFLDGFAPARNPELWEPALLAEVARHTRPGGSFATYTAAGAVRRALDSAGFDVTRQPGYGRKRHMTRGRLR